MREEEGKAVQGSESVMGSGWEKALAETALEEKAPVPAEMALAGRDQAPVPAEMALAGRVPVQVLEEMDLEEKVRALVPAGKDPVEKVQALVPVPDREETALAGKVLAPAPALTRGQVG